MTDELKAAAEKLLELAEKAGKTAPPDGVSNESIELIIHCGNFAPQIAKAYLAALAENGRLLAALEWYADEENWKCSPGRYSDEDDKASFDGGQRARDALGGG